MSPKYPRTAHLPFSPGGTRDDRRIESVRPFLHTTIVVTEKVDGSNVCLEHEACYARSHGSAPSHPSFDAFKAMHAGLRDRIPVGIQVFGEWLYARHSIAYDRLPGYFMIFGVRDTTTQRWSSWEEVLDWSERLSVPEVPQLLKGIVESERDFQHAIEGLAAAPSPLGEAREGLVVRRAGGFRDENFDTSVAKWVRKDHVQTDDHWKTQTIVKNGLAP